MIKRNCLPPKYLYKIIISFIFILFNFYFLIHYFSFHIITTFLHTIFVLIISYLFTDFLSVIGITGQISSGKSTFINYIHDYYKYPIISFDILNQQILEKDNVLNQIFNEFGEDVFYYNSITNKRTLNKKLIKEIIFKDKNKKKALEHITHPKIFLLFIQQFLIEKFIHFNKYVFVENALLIRFPFLRAICSNIISIVITNENILIERVMKRDNISIEVSKNIIKNQSTINQFKEYSNYIIYNDEDIFHFESNIRQIINNIIN